MIYAPNLTDKDIGSMMPPSPYPFIFEPGPLGYMIIMLGKHEQAQILQDSKGLLAIFVRTGRSSASTQRRRAIRRLLADGGL